MFVQVLSNHLLVLVITVKPVYKDHSRDQVLVVSVDRWSLYRGVLVSLRWPMEQPTVVTWI